MNGGHLQWGYSREPTSGGGAGGEGLWGRGAAEVTQSHRRGVWSYIVRRPPGPKVCHGENRFSLLSVRVCVFK